MSFPTTEIKPTSIKFSYNGEIRKLSAISNYPELIDMVQQAYGFDDGTFTVKYDDEEDRITVLNQEDYIMALEFFAGKVPKFVIESTLDPAHLEYSVISQKSKESYQVTKKNDEEVQPLISKLKRNLY